ncbi:MAG: sulfurtransferase [Alphaproteobacteria bacterium]|jgi:rhodanese-related sulfurtransferase|nr:sulfurtransferase [Alphaproteobacteria bacterium]
MRISVQELRRWLNADSRVTLLDCREDDEFAYCRIDGALHIPMAQTPQRTDELPGDRPIVVYCHHGVRSARVAAFLRDRGFANVYNLTGGVEAWSLQIDPSVLRY